MAKIIKKQTKQIEKFALNYYKKLDETHGVEHAKRTVKLAAYLAKREGANLQIVRLGAMLHQFHNSKIVGRLLRKIKLDEGMRKQIVHCVEYSDMKNIYKAKTIEAKVVYDADKLQVIGPFGIIREISCDMLPPRKMNFRQALKHTKMIENKCFKTLQTKTAKKLVRKPHQFILKFWKIFDKWDRVKL